MSKKTFIYSIVGGLILSSAIAFGTLFATTNNKAINLEEQINGSASAIEVQEKRRVDLILNLVDTVQAYDKHEKEALTLITKVRANASEGNVDNAELAITAVAEAYPELKSSENYRNLMTELSVTENLIAEHRNNYNIQVKSYNKFIRKFPTSFVLAILGYDKIDSEYLEYDAPTDAPSNLFD